MYIIVKKSYIEDHYEVYEVLGNHLDQRGAIAMVNEVLGEDGWAAAFEVPEFGFFEPDDGYDIADAIYVKKFDEGEESKREALRQRNQARVDLKLREHDIVTNFQKEMRERAERSSHE